MSARGHTRRIARRYISRMHSQPRLVRHGLPAAPPAKQEPQAVSILGTRGIPAAHSGFETFAERLGLHLADKGWRVTVYCQGEARRGAAAVERTRWRGVHLVTVRVAGNGPLSTVLFDLHCAWLALRDP